MFMSGLYVFDFFLLEKRVYTSNKYMIYHKTYFNWLS